MGIDLSTPRLRSGGWVVLGRTKDGTTTQQGRFLQKLAVMGSNLKALSQRAMEKCGAAPLALDTAYGALLLKTPIAKTTYEAVFPLTPGSSSQREPFPQLHGGPKLWLRSGLGPEQPGPGEAREVATGEQRTAVSWAGVGSSSGQARTPDTILCPQPGWLPARGHRDLKAGTVRTGRRCHPL